MSILSNQSSTMAKVTVTITRDYGKQKIELGAEFTIDALNESDLTRAYEELYSHVMAQHKNIIERVQSAANNGTPPPPPQANTSTNDIIIDVVALQVANSNGKRKYKVKGGNYSTHGVYLYPDERVITDVQNLIDFETLPYGDVTPPMPLKAIIQMNGQRPVKVRRLYPASQDEKF